MTESVRIRRLGLLPTLCDSSLRNGGGDPAEAAIAAKLHGENLLCTWHGLARDPKEAASPSG